MKPKVNGPVAAVVIALIGVAVAGCGAQSTATSTTRGTSTTTTTTATTAPSSTTSTAVPTTTSPPVTVPAPTTTAGVSPCTSNQLSVSSQPLQRVGQTVIFPIVFLNSGTTQCGLQGYPGVSAVVANGVQLGTSAARAGNPPGPLESLAPGQTTQALLTYQNPAATCAHPTAALGLRVYPPNQRAALFVSTGEVSLCAAPATNDLLIYPIGIGSQ